MRASAVQEAAKAESRLCPPIGRLAVSCRPDILLSADQRLGDAGYRTSCADRAVRPAPGRRGRQPYILFARAADGHEALGRARRMELAVARARRLCRVHPL